jgi:intracellular multiplication protein IcmP
MADKKGDSGLYENGIGWGIMLVILAVFVYIFWYYHATEVRNAVRWVRYAEMWVVSWFLGSDYTVIFNGKPTGWWQGYDSVPKWRADTLTFQHLSYFTSLSMQPLKPLFLLFAGFAAFWSLFYGPATQFRTVLNLEGLIKRQSKTFPVITPIVKFNPSNQPPRAPGSPVPAELPLFAEALGPEEWLAYNHIPAPDGKINEAAAAQAFEAQLGERWKGPNALKPHQQVLLATFALKAARKRKETDEMLGRLAMCWSRKGLRINRRLLRDARRILKNSDLAGKTLAQANRHAFVTTALMRALDFARREGGVLAPAQFLWLRGHDRALWYPLNNLGRQSHHTEALGAMAHFKAERLTQRPIPVPKIADAVGTIKEYMASQRARPIPQLDYSGSKKKGIKMAK